MKIVELLEGREDYIAKQQGPKILAAYQNDNGQKPNLSSPDNSLEVVKHISQASLPHVQWLVNQYIKGQYKLEDIGRLRQHIAKFNMIRTALPVNQRDLNKYPTLVDLYNVTRSHDEQKQRDEVAHKQVGAEHISGGKAKMIYNNGGVKVVQPLTQEASCYFGQDTEWCTAHEDDEYNYFDNYASRGELFIIRTKDGTMYQAHVQLVGARSQREEYDDYEQDEEGNPVDDDGDLINFEPTTREEIEFRDANDVEVDTTQVLKKHPEVKAALQAIHNASGSETFHPDLDKMSQAKLQTFIKNNPSKLTSIPENRVTKEMVLTYLDDHNGQISKVPKKFHNDREVIHKMLTKAAERGLVGDLPKHMLKFFTPQQKKEMVNNPKQAGWNAIKFAETEEEYIKLIKHNANVIRDIPKENQTEKVIQALLDDEPYNLGDLWQHIDDRFKTPKVLNRVLDRDATLLKYIPKEKQTQEMVNRAANADFSANHTLEYANPKFITDDVLVDVFAKESMAIPSYYKGKDFFDPKIRKVLERTVAKGAGLNWIVYGRKPEEIPQSIIRAAIKKNPQQLTDARVPSKEILQYASHFKNDASIRNIFGKPSYVMPSNWAHGDEEEKKVSRAFDEVQKSLPWAMELLKKYNKQYRS
jgi:hypothetical protein